MLTFHVLLAMGLPLNSYCVSHMTRDTCLARIELLWFCFWRLFVALYVFQHMPRKFLDLHRTDFLYDNQEYKNTMARYFLYFLSCWVLFFENDHSFENVLLDFAGLGFWISLVLVLLRIDAMICIRLFCNIWFWWFGFYTEPLCFRIFCRSATYACGISRATESCSDSEYTVELETL